MATDAAANRNNRNNLGNRITLPATIKAPVEHELVIRKSRFIAQLAPVESMAEADGIIAATRKRHWNANHNCVAIILGVHSDQQRSSDDGEPSGTAGVPILEVLRNHQLTDIVAVVTRYFGGVLLGAGGLIRAYSSATAAALVAAQSANLIVPRRMLTEVTFTARFSDAGRVENFIRNWVSSRDAVIEPTKYGQDAEFTVLAPPDQLANLQAELAAVSAGAIRLHIGADRVVDLG